MVEMIEGICLMAFFQQIFSFTFTKVLYSGPEINQVLMFQCSLKHCAADIYDYRPTSPVTSLDITRMGIKPASFNFGVTT